MPLKLLQHCDSRSGIINFVPFARPRSSISNFKFRSIALLDRIALFDLTSGSLRTTGMTTRSKEYWVSQNNDYFGGILYDVCAVYGDFSSEICLVNETVTVTADTLYKSDHPI